MRRCNEGIWIVFMSHEAGEPFVRSPEGAIIFILNSMMHACFSLLAPSSSPILSLSISRARLCSTRLIPPTRAMKLFAGCKSAGDVLKISRLTSGISGHATVVGSGRLPSYATIRIGGSAAPKRTCFGVLSLRKASSLTTGSSFHDAFASLGSPGITLNLISFAAET